MTVRHYLIGYEKWGSGLAVEFAIEPTHFGEVRSIVGSPADDPGLINPIELDARQAEAIAAVTGRRINGDAYEYFLQASR